MDKSRQAVKTIHISDDTGSVRRRGGLHPLSRLFVTLLYILFVLSFSPYNLLGLAGMVLYLLAHVIWYEISLEIMVKRVWPVFLLTSAVGIAGLVLNRESYVRFGDITITYGMVSMVTLIVKGIFCVTASYILAVTAGIGQICYALRILHIPEEIVTVIMLMHRYLMVLIKEVERMQQAYRLRAPGQKGLHFRTWGSFVGLLLLRSMDRAQEVYESMGLRGFQGKMQYLSVNSNKGASILYVFLWGLFFVTARIFPIFQMVGNLFQG